MIALLNIFKFLAVYVSTVLSITKHCHLIMLFTNKINTPPTPTGKVSMESSKDRKYCNTKVFYFFKPFYQLVFWIPVQN